MTALNRALTRVAALYVVLWGVEKLERVAYAAGAADAAAALPDPAPVVVVLAEGPA